MSLRHPVYGRYQHIWHERNMSYNINTKEVFKIYQVFMIYQVFICVDISHLTWEKYVVHHKHRRNMSCNTYVRNFTWVCRDVPYSTDVRVLWAHQHKRNESYNIYTKDWRGVSFQDMGSVLQRIALLLQFVAVCCSVWSRILFTTRRIVLNAESITWHEGMLEKERESEREKDRDRERKRNGRAYVLHTS